MRAEIAQALPCAREQGLLVRELADEVLVYDLTRHKAFCLNKAAAAVWEHCDGNTPVAEIARSVERELEAPLDERLVWLALDQLARARLLRERGLPGEKVKRISRREWMEKAGATAAIALPLITSVIAPSAAQAATQCSVTVLQCNRDTVGCCCSGFTPPRLCVADSTVTDGGVCRSGTSCT